MRNSLGNLDVQPANLVSSVGWRDPRLWIGLTLVAVSVVVGAKVVGGGDDSVAMWAVAADRAPGDRIGPADLVVSRVRFADPTDARRYFRADESLPTEVHLQRVLGRGELIPRAGLGPAPTDTVQVSVSVAPGSLPPGVGVGTVVDLWSAPRAGGTDTRAEQLVSEVMVLDLPRQSGDFGTGVGEAQVVLAVPDRTRQLGRVLAAGNAGELLIVGRG